MRTITIELPASLLSFVEEKVTLGLYANPSSIIENLIARAYREDIEKMRAAGVPVVTTQEELEQHLPEAIEEDERGEATPWDLAEMKRRARDRFRERQQGKP